MFRTKRIGYLTLVFCFLVVSFTSRLWSEQEGEEEASSEAVFPKQPQITFDAVNYDAGEVWEADVVSHDFTVKNTGTSELTISGVKPG